MLGSGFGQFGVDPFAEMRRMQNDMNRLASSYARGAEPRDFPPVNLWLGEHSVVVTAELPGASRDDVTISLQEDVLTLQGERKPASSDGEIVWHRRERASGRFSRTIQLPFRADPDRVQARFSNGTLEIELPRPEADRPRRIEIRAG
ncbi:MAG: Hsp20/alpha crystallin family protein [Alphaproteobacteria bacterium]|nr:Hsp20/alpha crystallin family protein [Alphaproteobacteria bacterium]